MLVTIGLYPQQLTKEVNFLVVGCSSTYNAIIGHPTLNTWWATTSIYHLLVKFPTEYGIEEAQGDQMATREFHIAILEMDDHLQALNIEERNIIIWKKSPWMIIPLVGPLVSAHKPTLWFTKSLPSS